MATDGTGMKSEVKGDLAQLLELFDGKSRTILWYLWWNRHAHISQLRKLVDASSDFEVLFRLRNIINEKAQKLWGKPVVGFEEHKIDPLTGEKVLFNWWFREEETELITNNGRPLVDVFEEKHGLTIIAQLPNLEEFSRPAVEFRNGLVKIRLRRKDAKGSTKGLPL
jgi:HSP20 family molecular chaperone IbpA